MAIMIQPIPDSVRLRITGDVETLLSVPYEDDDRFLLGVSDGTLLLGTYDDKLRCTWRIVREGVGLVHVTGDAVALDGPAQWVVASQCDASLIEPRQPQTLPLFPSLDKGPA